jgi:two-component system sensor histidine kinase BaeS
MRLGITARLFLAFLAASILVVLAMGAASRWSFVRGFIGYLNDQGVARVEELVPVVADAYRTNGGWGFLHDNARAWFRLVRPQRPIGDDPDGPPPFPPESEMTGITSRLALLDADHKLVSGNPRVGADAAMRPIVVAERTVGWLAVLPFEGATEAADVHFQEQQLRAGWAIGAASVLLAALVAGWLARALLAPVKRVAEATHRLAAGDYTARVAVVSRDEIGRLATDFNGLANTLERNERMRREFIADVSHELRTPLAVLRGELEAVEDGVRPLTTATVSSLQGEVRLLSKLVDDLYDLSLADVGALNYRRVPLDVADLLGGMLAAYRDRFAERDVALDEELPASEVTLLADEQRLRQLLGNLLENSLRYTDRGGRLVVRCRRIGRDVAIDFEDSAPGVAPDLVPRLFERFYRVEGSRNRAHGGAGLGLAICRSIVEAHRGTITASSSRLGGLAIAIRLPVED